MHNIVRDIIQSESNLNLKGRDSNEVNDMGHWSIETHFHGYYQTPLHTDMILVHAC